MTTKNKGTLGRAVDRARVTGENLAEAVEQESKTKTKTNVSDYIKACLARNGEADEVAKDLRKLAKVFDEVGPGHAAVLRGFAARLDGGEK